MASRILVNAASLTTLVTLVIWQLSATAQTVDPSAPGVSNDLPRPYTTERSWGELPSGTIWAAVTAVEPSPDGRFIYVGDSAGSSAYRSGSTQSVDLSGRLVIPVGDHWQVLEVHRRTEDGFERKEVSDVRLVPMTGEVRRGR